MPILINNQTNQPEDLNHDQLSTALQSGTHSMQAGSSLNLLDKDGQPVSIPAEHVYNAVQEGYKFPSQAHVDSVFKDQEMQQKYGEGLDNEVGAGIEGAARGLTFGASDIALPKLYDATGGALGISKEMLTEHKNRNPISANLGNIAGVVGSALTGEGAVGLLTKGAGKVAVNETARKVIGKYGAAALGSAIEGAAYSGGNIVSEAALGDPSLNGEKALSELGWGAITGGVIGGAFAGAADVLPATFNKAKSFFASEDNAATRLVSEASGKVSQKSPDAILKTITDRKNQLAPEEMKGLVTDFTAGFKEQTKAVDAAEKNFRTTIRPTETAQLIDPTLVDKAQAAHGNFAAKLDDTIETMRAEPEIYDQRVARKLELARDGLSDSASLSSADAHAELSQSKKLVSDQLNYGKSVPSGFQDTAGALETLKHTANDALIDEGVFGAAAARQEAVNNAYTEYLSAQKQVNSNMMRKVGGASGRPVFEPIEAKVASSLNSPEKLADLQRFQKASKGLLDEIENSHNAIGDQSFDKNSVLQILQKNKDIQDKLSKGLDYQKLVAQLGSKTGLSGDAVSLGIVGHFLGAPAAAAMEAYNVLGKPALIAQRLGSMERMLGKVTDAVTSGSKAVFTGISRNVAVMAGSKAAAGLSSAMYDKTVEDIQKHTQDPGLLASKMTTATQGAVSYAPKMVDATHQATARALSFLATKIPPTSAASPLDARPTVSAPDRAKFGRYLEAVNSPTSLLNKIKQGTLTHEHVEALQAVYPALYQSMQQSITNEMASFRAKSPKAPIPIRLQTNLSLFMGHNMTSSLSPAAMQSNQAVFAGPAPANLAVGGKVTQKGLSNLNLGSRSTTLQNQALSRRQE